MTKRHAILHIGTWKTGTTAIQAKFGELRAELLAQGAYYRRSPSGSASPLLIQAARGRRQASAGRADPGAEPDAEVARLQNEFADEMSTLPPHVERVIFSDERLVANFRTAEELIRLREFLSSWFDRFSIVLYIRRQDMFAASLYSQRLRGGFIGPPLDPQMIRWVESMGDYHGIVARWSSAFGAEAIRLRIYENAENGERFDSIRDIFEQCGLRPPPPDTSERRRKPSISLTGQAILRETGRKLFNPEAELQVVSGQWKKLTALVTARYPGTGWQPTRAEAQSVVARFEAGNEALRQRYCPARQSLFSRTFDSLPEHPVMPSEAALFEGACALLAEVLGQRSAPSSGPMIGIRQEMRKATRRGKKKRAGADA